MPIVALGKGASQIANYNLGSVTGEVRIDYDGKGVKEAKADVKGLGDETTASSAKTEKASGSFRSFRKEVSDFGSDVRNTRDAVSAFGGILSGLAKPVAIAAAAHDMALLGVAVAPAAGAVAVLPGILLAAASAMAVVKIGTAGMGDAFKAVAEGDAAKLDEAMKKLSPSAQGVVRAYQATKPALDALRMDVQERLMLGYGAAIQGVAQRLLPTLQAGLGSIASALNSVGHGIAESLTAPETADDLAVLFDNTAGFIHESSAAAGLFIQGILRIAAIGSQMLPAWGAGLGEVAQRFKEWALSAEGTAKINEVMTKGLSVLGDLYFILTNIASIAASVFRPLAGDAQAVLPMLVAMTREAAAWASSAEGQEQIAAIWQLLAVVGGQLMLVIQTIAPILGQLVTWFTQLPAPVQAVIGSFLGWATVIGLILAKTAPLIAFFIQLGPLITKIPAALTLLANGFSKVMAVFRTLTALFMANPWILLIAAVVALAYIIYSNWDAISAYLSAVWGRIVAFFSTTGESLKTIGTAIWSVISSAWTTAITAISTFFSGVWAGVMAVWTSVTTALTSAGTTVWGIISGIWQAVIGALVAYFTGVWTIVTAVWQALISSILAIGSAIWNTILTIWQAAILTIYALVTGQFNLIGQIWQTLIDKIKAIGSNLWNTISSIWSAAISTIVGVISGFVSTVTSFVSNLVSRVVAFFSQLGSQVVSSVSSFVSTVISRVSSFVSSVVAAAGNLASQFAARVSQMVSQAIAFFSNLASQGPARISAMASSVISAVSNMASQLVSRISSGAAQAIAAFGRLASGAISALASLPGRMAGIGGSIISGIISGISGAAGRLFSYLGGLATQALNSAKAAFGINSPSKLFRDTIGKSIPEGIEVGIIQTARLATGAAADLAAATANAAKKEVTVKWGSVSETMWDQLRGLGYKGRADDGMEALYVPQQILDQLNGMTGDQQSRIAALSQANAVSNVGSALGTATMAPPAATATRSTITIEQLVLDVKGIIDPTDPVSWRRFGEEVRDLIKDVEDSYK